MKILVGSLQQESNSFSPVMTSIGDFDYLEGEDIFQKLAIKEIFENAGAELMPTIYANALPSGIIKEKAFRYFKDKLIDRIPKDEKVDGIWLYLHGAMEVENIGSGEANLVREIRHIVGEDVPIAITLDLHANNTQELVDVANVICGYRTAPHTDQVETQIRTAKLLLKCIKENILPKPIMIPLPLILSGDKATTPVEPLKSLIARLDKIETIEGILSASLFIGMAWVDVPNSHSSIIMIPYNTNDVERAQLEGEKLARDLFAKREEFVFEEMALRPAEAIEKALVCKEAPVFIADSGDNTTGGAPGFNTVMLDLFLKQDETHNKKICIAGIIDEKAVEACSDYPIGDDIQLTIGTGEDENSKQLSIKGKLKARGRILGWTGEDAGESCIISTGKIDIILAEKRCAFTSNKHFETAGSRISDYDVIVVKQGYLFDSLKSISKCSILALTPGACNQVIEELGFKNLKRPIYPLDQEVAMAH